MSLPSPATFGFRGFNSWRPGQNEAVERVLRSEKRVNVECLPTGSGKTLVGAFAGRMTGRTLYLTRRRGLQTQIQNDFGTDEDREMNGANAAFNVWGQAGYSCRLSQEDASFSPVTVDEAPCQAGYQCVYKHGGCEYYDALSYVITPTPKLVVTNYTWWFHHLRTKVGQKIEPFDMIIVDEAHGLLDELSKFLTVTLRARDFNDIGVRWPSQNGADIEMWKEWVRETGGPAVRKIVGELERQVDGQVPTGATAKAVARRLRKYERILDRLRNMLTLRGRGCVS